MTAALLSLFGWQAQAQLSQGGSPYSFQKNLSVETPVVKMGTVDVAALVLEDLERDLRKDLPWRFGHNFEVSLDNQKDGLWTKLEDGSRLWTLAIESPGAYHINLNFGRYNLPKGGQLFIYNADRSMVIGAFTEANNNPAQVLATTLVQGEKVIVEYFEPRGAAFAGELAIDIVTHGYRDAFAFANSDKGFGTSGACNNNVACDISEGWEDPIRSAVMLVTGSSGFCSGAMINNTAEDGKPYVLSANHCYTNPASVILWFNWQSETCSNPSSSPAHQSLSGGVDRAKAAASDFWLFEMNDEVPESYEVFFAGWNNENINSTSSVGIHHPAGDIKKFSVDEDPTISSEYMGTTPNANGTHLTILDWDSGTTEPGSSGSPLFDQNQRIIGQLHGGYAACGNDDLDSYGKFAYSWNTGSTAATRLSDWLDPQGTGVTVFDGYDPNRPLVDNDAQLFNISIPEDEYPGQTDVTPTVTIRNRGTLNLTSLTVSYNIDGGTQVNTSWSGNLAPNATAEVSFPEITLEKGDHTFNASTSLPNGAQDQNTANDTKSKAYFVRADYDLGIARIISPKPAECSPIVTPSFEVINRGGQTITAFEISYTIDGGEAVVINWTGSLAMDQTTVVEFDGVELEPSEYSLTASVKNPNGMTDENEANNQASVEFANLLGQNVVMNMTTDNYGDETSWGLFQGDEQIFSGGPLSDATNYIEEFCLTDGCYSFIVLDSFGDGIFAPGGYSLYNESLDVTYITGGGDFDDQEQTDFCIIANPEPNDAIVSALGYEGGCNSTEITPLVEITSFGGETLTSLDFTYSLGDNEMTYTWIGEIGLQQSEVISLPAISGILGMSELTVTASAPNSQDDADPSDNSMSMDVELALGQAVTLRITTDNFSEETTWAVLDEDDQVMASGGDDYVDATTYDESFCLSMGQCYTFVVYDSYGDGLITGGVVIINDATGEVLFTAPDFDDEVSYELCLTEDELLATMIMPESACEGSTLSFVATSSLATSWNWTFESGSPATASTQSALVTYAEAGTFDVSLTVGDGTSTATETGEITIGPMFEADYTMTEPSAGSTADGAIQLTVTGGTEPYSYLWNDGSTGATMEGAAVGTYVVVITDASDCTMSMTIEMIVTSVAGPNGTTSYLVFPNPSNGLFNVQILDGMSTNIFLYDMTGRLVMARREASNQVEVDLSQHASGIYNLVLQNAIGVSTTRLVKE